MEILQPKNCIQTCSRKFAILVNFSGMIVKIALNDSRKLFSELFFSYEHLKNSNMFWSETKNFGSLQKIFGTLVKTES